MLMRTVLTGAALTGPLVGALEYPYIGSFDDGNCTHATKQLALYLDLDVEPPLNKAPAQALKVRTTWRNVTDIRRYGKNGVFAAHPWQTPGGPGGYFGSQVDGEMTSNSGGLLFSTWDDKQANEPCADPAAAPNQTWCDHKHAFPLSPNCHRHCLDCGLHPGWHNTTGTQCSVHLNFTDGDEVLFDMQQTDTNASYVFEGVTYVGSVWTLVAQYTLSAQEEAPKTTAGEPAASRARMPKEVQVGQVFLERSLGGISRLGAFHEHIGCTPCDAFYESEVREGPWISAPLERNVTNVTFTRKKGHCQLYDVTALMPGSALIETGPGTGPAFI